MRLTPQEQTAIRTTILAIDPNAKIYLFGSRADDAQKGGDIDIYVDSKTIKLSQKIDIQVKLYDLIGEQKIDIVTPNETNQEFITLILKKAIQL